MATYIPNVTDYIPQVQPFVPDYNFYSGVLQMKQGKYDAARKEISSLYGSLLNAPLTRDDNTATRDKFFQTIDQDIHRISGTDLSLNQNVTAAKAVFSQLLDNDHIRKDMVWTRNLHNEFKRAEGFRMCKDPEKCGGSWWEGGERLLSYAAEDFKNVSLEESMNMRNPRFVPYQDVTKKALQLAKDADLNVSYDQVSGQWITTTKNGPLIQEPLYNLFMGSISSDPKVMEYFLAQAELQRKDFMYSNKDQYGSLEAAEQAYIEQTVPVIEQLRNRTIVLEDKISTLDEKKKRLQEKIDNSAPYKQKEYEDWYNAVTQTQGMLQSSLDEATDATGEMQIAANNKQYTGAGIDRMIASISLMGEITNAAKIMSQRGAEFKLAVNPYALEATKHQNAMLLEEFRWWNKKQFELWKGKVKELQESKDAVGTEEANNPKLVDVFGAADVGNQDIDSPEYKERGYLAFDERRDEVQTNITTREKVLGQSLLDGVLKEAESGDRIAMENYVNMVEQYLRVTAEPEQYDIGTETQGITPNANAIRSQNAAVALRVSERSLSDKTLAEKYEIAKTYMKNKSVNELGNSGADLFYSNVVEPLINPEKNKLRSQWMTELWDRQDFVNMRNEIASKNLALTEFKNVWAEQIKGAAEQARSQNGYGPLISDALLSYYDDEGNIVDKQTFLQNMVNRNSSYGIGEMYEYVSAMYDGDYVELGMGEHLHDNEGISSSFGVGFGDFFTGRWGELEREVKSVSTWAKEAFTDFADVTKSASWTGMLGMGNYTTRGQNYSNVDAASPRSLGAMGFNGFLKDAMNSGSAVFSFGGFQMGLPENDPKAKEIVQILAADWRGRMDKDTRPILDVTYSHIAAGDRNKVGMNIKLNPAYMKLYAGSEDNPGLMRNTDLATNGITVIMDKADTQNIFTLGMEKSPAETVMDFTGRVPLNSQPEYVKDAKVEVDENMGMYKASGMYMAGLLPDGNPNWNYFESYYSLSQDLNSILGKFEAMIAETAAWNKALEKQYVANSHSNPTAYAGQ